MCSLSKISLEFHVTTYEKSSFLYLGFMEGISFHPKQ